MNETKSLLWSRRAFLATSATTASTLALKARSASASCTLDPELTQGPYYLDREILRRNITEGRPGVPLHLRVAILDARTCEPVSNAALEIWHCDASGIYSGFTKMSPDGMGRGPGMPPPPPPGAGRPFRQGEEGMSGPPPSFGRRQKPDATTFCRGVQLSTANGSVEFETIYPGWYVGRDTHIHLKVHVGGIAGQEKYSGGRVSHTGQLFFSDELTDRIAKLEPYVTHHAPRIRLDEDMVYADAHGSASMLDIEPLDPHDLSKGLVGRVTLHVDPSATSIERGPGGGGRPPGPPPDATD